MADQDSGGGNTNVNLGAPVVSDLADPSPVVTNDAPATKRTALAFLALVVAHGRFLRVLLATLLNDYGLERMHEIHHTNTGVNHLVGDCDRFEARRLNCTAHLEAADLLEVE